MKKAPMLALMLGVPLLAGCSTPTAQWRYVEFDPTASSGDYSGLGKFSLARSILLLQAGASAGASPTLQSLPAEATGPHTQFGLAPQPGSPAPHITALDGTRLVHRLSLDNAEPPRRTAPLSVSASVDRDSKTPTGALPTLPLALDVQPLLGAARREALQRYAVLENSGHKVAVELVVDPVPADAIETATLDLSKTGGLYFYSACRSATLTLLSEPFKHQQYTVTVADPNFVQTVALLPGRAVLSHSACGVDLGGDGESATALNELSQASARARSVARAWESTAVNSEADAVAQVTATQKAVIAVRRAVAAAKAAAAEQKRRDEALRSADVQPRPATPQRETFSF